MLDALAHYTLLESIGVGGIGEVYRARDTKLGRTTAIKVVRPEIVDDPSDRQTFLQQASALKALSHPNIASLFDVGTDGPHLFLAIEWVPGEPLRSVIGGRALNIRRALDLGIGLADALADGHAMGLVHGDLTSDNVTVTPTEHAKLLDYGLSAWTNGGAARADRPRRTRRTRMSRRFVPPRIWRRSRRLEGRATIARTSSRWVLCCMRCSLGVSRLRIERWPPRSCASRTRHRHRPAE